MMVLTSKILYNFDCELLRAEGEEVMVLRYILKHFVSMTEQIEYILVWSSKVQKKDKYFIFVKINIQEKMLEMVDIHLDVPL